MPDEMDFEKALARYVRFHRQHVSDPLPDPPAEWKDLTGEFARILTESTPPPRQRFGWWTLAGIAAVAAAGVYVLELRQAAPPPVTKQPAIAPIVPAVKPPPPSPPKSAVHGEPQPDLNIEVRIFAALHRVAADVGEPVEVNFQGGQWFVKFVQTSPSRTEQLNQALAPLTQVKLIVNEAPTSLEGFSEERRVQSATASLIFAKKLEDHFGTRAALTTATNRAFDRSQSILARAHALQLLDERFPPALHATLGQEELRLLRGMRMDHRQAAATARKGVESDYGLLAAALNLNDAGNPGTKSTLWNAAYRWDHVLSIVLGGAATPLDPDGLKKELSEAFAHLDAALGELP